MSRFQKPSVRSCFVTSALCRLTVLLLPLLAGCDVGSVETVLTGPALDLFLSRRTPTPVDYDFPTEIPTVTPTSTSTPTPTLTPTKTNTPTRTPTPSRTSTPRPTNTPMPPVMPTPVPDATSARFVLPGTIDTGVCTTEPLQFQTIFNNVLARVGASTTVSISGFRDDELFFDSTCTTSPVAYVTATSTHSFNMAAEQNTVRLYVKAATRTMHSLAATAVVSSLGNPHQLTANASFTPNARATKLVFTNTGGTVLPPGAPFAAGLTVPGFSVQAQAVDNLPVVLGVLSVDLSASLPVRVFESDGTQCQAEVMPVNGRYQFRKANVSQVRFCLRYDSITPVITLSASDMNAANTPRFTTGSATVSAIRATVKTALVPVLGALPPALGLGRCSTKSGYRFLVEKLDVNGAAFNDSQTLQVSLSSPNGNVLFYAGSGCTGAPTATITLAANSTNWPEISVVVVGAPQNPVSLVATANLAPIGAGVTPVAVSDVPAFFTLTKPATLAAPANPQSPLTMPSATCVGPFTLTVKNSAGTTVPWDLTTDAVVTFPNQLGGLRFYTTNRCTGPAAQTISVATMVQTVAFYVRDPANESLQLMAPNGGDLALTAATFWAFAPDPLRFDLPFAGDVGSSVFRIVDRHDERPAAMALLGDKVVTVGTSAGIAALGDTGSELLVTRTSTEGMPDATFGTNGQFGYARPFYAPTLPHPFTGGVIQTGGSAVLALPATNKILVAGWMIAANAGTNPTAKLMLVARMDATTGVLDSTWGLETSPPQFNPNGTTKRTGFAAIELPGFDADAVWLGIVGSNLFVAGNAVSTGAAPSGDFALLRLSAATGDLVEWATLDVGGDARLTSAVLAPTGGSDGAPRLFLVGNSKNGAGLSGVAVASFKITGLTLAVDTSFVGSEASSSPPQAPTPVTPGRVVLRHALGGDMDEYFGNAAVLQYADRFVIAGHTTQGGADGKRNLVLLRLHTTDGTLDTAIDSDLPQLAFHSYGYTVISYDQSAEAYALALDPRDQSLVVGGTLRVASGNRNLFVAAIPPTGDAAPTGDYPVRQSHELGNNADALAAVALLFVPDPADATASKPFFGARGGSLPGVPPTGGPGGPGAFVFGRLTR